MTWNREQDDPFAVLGIAPTLEAAEVKRAYFAALKQCPPHRDPGGFKRIRTAYEALGAPGALAAAYLVAPDEVDPAAQALESRWRAALDAASDAAREELRAREIVTAFVATISAQTYLDATRPQDDARA